MRSLLIIMLVFLCASFSGCSTSTKTVENNREMRATIDSLRVAFVREVGSVRKEREQFLSLNKSSDTVYRERVREIVIGERGDTLHEKTKEYEKNVSSNNSDIRYIKEVSDSAFLREVQEWQRQIYDELTSLKEASKVKVEEPSFIDRVKISTWWFLLVYSVLLTVITVIFIKKRLYGKAN